MTLWNQKIAFSSYLSKSSRRSDVFWPGCAALKLDAVVIKNTFLMLRKAIPDTGFSSWCCGKPTFILGTNQEQEKRYNQLEGYFESFGIKNIYTLCPNCTHTLQKFSDIHVMSAYTILYDQLKRENFSLQAKKKERHYFLHDPCMANDETREAIRNILQVLQIDYDSKELNNQSCCGRKNMLFLTNKPASEKIMAKRIAEFQDKPVISYCASCVDAFTQHDVEAFHLLEIIFQIKSKSSFMNRIKTVHTKEFYV